MGNAAAKEVSCEATEVFAVEFVPETTLSVSSRLILTGTGATLTLRSSAYWQAWYVECLGVKTLSGLLVSDSTATFGTMRAESSTAGGRNFVLESGATIDFSNRGFPCGPGAGSNTGGSCGGRAIAHSANYSEDKTYGSILWPTDLGFSTGGGAVILTVAGLSRIDGTIVANGVYSQYCSGSGGGIALKTRELVCAGTLSADGGGTSSKGYYFGGGGRVAVILTGSGSTFDSFTGFIHA